jgi:riboflavin-specific deaminase-like protein
MSTRLKTENSIKSWLAELPARASDHHHRTGRPLVTLAYAQSLDGCIAARRGQGLAISGPESMALTHQLRAQQAAILVGIGTVLADDPQLTVRLAPGASPLPVVLDSRLRFPLSARLLLREDQRPWIFCAAPAAASTDGSDRRAEMERRGAHILPVARDASGQLDLAAVLAKLAQAGITSLMVEGGARVISRVLALGLVDQVMITTAPVWLGGLRAVDFEQPGPAATPAIIEPDYARFGADLVTWGRLARAESEQ